MPSSSCAQCGRPVADHDRHVRFHLPDPVRDLQAQERTPGIWMSEEDPWRAVLLQAPEVGAFVRCLLEVALTGGHTVTFGVWLGVAPEVFQRTVEAWWAPEYPDLVLEGRLANALPGWGLLGATARAVVRDEDATPFIVRSDDTQLARVLTDTWPHDDVLDLLPT